MVDVGAAAIVAFCGKTAAEDVNGADLEKLAGFLEEQYHRKYLTGYLVCVFPNSAYVNPTAGADKKRAFLETHLYGFREVPAPGAPSCGLCGRPAALRGFRQHVPLLTGEGTLNFFPNGQPGLPLCSGCMISIAALPLGALRCAGRALIVHADDPELTTRIATGNVLNNLQYLQLKNLADDDKFPDAKQARTRLIDRLREWAGQQNKEDRRAASGRRRPTSLTAYHLTNSGQGPDLDIYHLPSPVLAFLIEAEAPQYCGAWSAIIQAAWRLDEPDKTVETARRNYLYEDLFRLPEEWPQFIRRYFLRRAYKAARKEDPRSSYSPTQELERISWPLTELFLKEVTGMDRHRVETIRAFGDRLAAYINANPSFWNDFNLAKTYRGLSARLIRANREEQKAGRQPLFGFDEFITIFEYGEDQPRSDWWLARDLTLIRVVEQLHQREFFQKHPEAQNVPSAAEREAEEETDAEA